MTLNGWIAIPRSVLTAEWYVRADAFTRALWLHLMLSANFAPSVTRDGLALSPGQVVTSWNALADALAWHDREKHRAEKPTRSKVRRAAAFLRNAGEATYRPTGGPTHTGTVITLERWAFYANEVGASADATTDPPAGGVPEPRPHCKNTTGYVDPHERQTAKSVLREAREWTEKARRGRLEVLEVRRREREGPETPRGAPVGKPTSPTLQDARDLLSPPPPEDVDRRGVQGGVSTE